MNRYAVIPILVFFIIAAALGAEWANDDILMNEKTHKLTSLARILIVLGASTCLVMVGFSTLTRSIASAPVEYDAKGHPVRSASRVLSVIPLAKAIIIVIVIVAVFLIILNEVGVQIGPLLAGAGIIGLTLGLGAQNLVRDVLAGMFFMADDAFRMGEYVEIGTKRGKVEKIALRSIQLRHHRGQLHTIPYSRIDSVTNNSRDWLVIKLEIWVPHDTDTDLLNNVVAELAGELKDDPKFTPFMLDALRCQGIDYIDHLGLMMRLRFKTIPGDERFRIKREILRRLKLKFEANGIRFARRNVVVDTLDQRSAAAVEVMDGTWPGR